MKFLLPILFLASLAACLAEEYSVKYNDAYSYVVELSDGKLKTIYLAEKGKGRLFKIPQTVRLDGFTFSILCDLHSTTPDGTTVTGLANIKGEVQMTKDSKPIIDGNTGFILKDKPIKK